MCSTLSQIFFSVSKGNDFNEDRIGTITSEFHEKELDADRIRTVADELEEEDVLLCELCEFVLVESCSEDRLFPWSFFQSVAAHFVIRVLKSISSRVTFGRHRSLLRVPYVLSDWIITIAFIAMTFSKKITIIHIIIVFLCHHGYVDYCHSEYKIKVVIDFSYLLIVSHLTCTFFFS